MGASVPIEIRLSDRSISAQAVLKTCYWYSREFFSEVREEDQNTVVTLTPKGSLTKLSEELRRDFISDAMDFALRELIDAKTSSVRDTLLAKAFAEAGVLEDDPEGTFGDRIEENKTNGMFKILNNR